MTNRWARLAIAALLAATLSMSGCDSDEGGGDTGGSGGSGGTGGGMGGAGGAGGLTLIDDPTMDVAPELLSQIGLYPQAPDLGVVHPRAVRYEPTWPLWSNGSAKDRYLVLPPGTTIDNRDRPWRYPEGTLFFKTFSYPVEGEMTPVETRMMRLEGGEWEFYVYQWNEARTEATLRDMKRSALVPATAPDGRSFEHRIPNKLDCRSCHETHEAPIIGFDELDLNAPLEGAVDSQLVALDAAGLFMEAPPAEPERVAEADELTRQVVGYMQGNCAYCHNAGGGPSAAFDLRHEVAVANMINQETTGSASAPGIRIVPGSPEESILFQAVSMETDDPEVKLMPPDDSIQLLDLEFIERLRTWISGLPTE